MKSRKKNISPNEQLIQGVLNNDINLVTESIANGADLNRVDDKLQIQYHKKEMGSTGDPYYSVTPLIYSISKGYQPIVKLLAAKADVNQTVMTSIHNQKIAGGEIDTQDWSFIDGKRVFVSTALLECLKYHTPLHYKMLPCLLKRGALVKLTSEQCYARYFIESALQREQADTVTICKLLVTAGTNIRDDLQFWLADVIKSQNIEMLKFFHEHIPLKNWQCSIEKPLIVAVESGKIDVVLFFLENGADVNHCDYYSDLALIAAIESGRHHAFDIVKLLLLYNADVNKINVHGKTPLIAACDRMNLNFVNTLLEAGAKVWQCDSQGYCPMQKVIDEGRIDLLKVVLNHQIDLSEPAICGETCLMYAIKKSKYDIANFLITTGIDLSFANSDGHSAFHYAVEKKATDVVASLLQKAPRSLLSQVNHLGQTPLYIAAVIAQSVEIVKMLLTAGAPDLPNTQGITAEIASTNNTIRMLLSEARKAKQLRSSLFAFEEAQEAALSQSYSSPEEAKIAMNDLAHMTMLSIEHNIHFITQNRDRLPINYKHDLINLIAQLSTLLTILNQDDMPVNARSEVDAIAASVRNVAAKLGNVIAKTTTEHFPVNNSSSSSVSTSSFSPGLFQSAKECAQEEKVTSEKKDFSY